ncbi:MAG: class I SAM-dependent methyltransferase, partial [Candidatus Aminicenantes bacterium]|nr:class I SAM-dependent methyltransferase [Candidatus Aminicenantes bacterium]
RVYSLEAGKPYCFRYDTNGLLEIYIGSHSREDVYDLAPFVPTPMVVVEKMLEMAEVTSRDTVYDLGCGDGRIVIMAARKYGARAVGIDLDENLLREARFNASAGGVSSLVEFINQDVTKADISAATVVTLYLLPESNLILKPLFIRQLRRGTRVVSHNYRIDGWEDREKESVTLKDEEGEDHNVYLYIR